MLPRPCSAPSPAGAIPNAKGQLDRADDGQDNGNNDDGRQPGRTGGKQSEREMEELFHSFVVPRIRKFGQIAARR
jgi:hypothetical protein